MSKKDEALEPAQQRPCHNENFTWLSESCRSLTVANGLVVKAVRDPNGDWDVNISADPAVLVEQPTKILAMQVRPSEFAQIIDGKDSVTGIPVYWAEWPNKEAV